MVSVVLIAQVTIFICYVGNIMAADPLRLKYGQLVFSTLVYRHGDRAIIDRVYSSDPYATKSYWPMGFGQLTPTGVERHYELGKWLRERYSGWLPEIYSADDVYVQSSDVDRTIISAQANLAGLYPSVGRRDRNGLQEKVHVQLVPIHTISAPLDNMLGMKADCPMYSQEFAKLKNDIVLQQFYRQFSLDFEYIANKTNLEMSKNTIYLTTMLLYDSLLVETQFNYTLPKWTRKIFPEPLLTMAKQNFELMTHTDIMKRLKAGPLLQEIVTHMHGKKTRTLNPDRILWIYSAHDITIVNLLNSMKLYDRIIPPYAAVLMIELRLNTTENYVVTISYRNSSSHEPYLLHVPGCDSAACELDQFIDVLRPVITVDWKSECKPNFENDFLELLIYFISIVLAVVIIMLVSYAIADKILCCFRRRNNYHSF